MTAGQMVSATRVPNNGAACTNGNWLIRSVSRLGSIDHTICSAFLAPDIVEAIAAGRQPPELTAHRLIRTVDLPIAWTAQKQLLGLV
jgi:hypothetical protein